MIIITDNNLEMKEKGIISEDDNLFDGAFDLVVDDLDNANFDNNDNEDYRELLVINEYIQGRVDKSGDKYLYRIFPYEISDTIQKYLYMKNFNPKVLKLLITTVNHFYQNIYVVLWENF